MQKKPRNDAIAAIWRSGDDEKAAKPRRICCRGQEGNTRKNDDDMKMSVTITIIYCKKSEFCPTDGE